MYVWCDALTNYISGLGYFTDHEEKHYWEDATVTRHRKRYRAVPCAYLAGDAQACGCPDAGSAF